MDLFQILRKVQAEEVLSQAESNFLLALFITEDGEERFMKAMESHWNGFDSSRTELNSEELLKKVHQQIYQKRRSKQRSATFVYLRYALECAAVLLLAFLGSLWFRNTPPPSLEPPAATAHVEMYNPKGLRTIITLPDSSKVTLNADTRISYTYNFEASVRSVTLEGEAFFDVFHDKMRPFIVQAKDAKFTVLGTSFNVRAYPEHNSVDATLIEGSLKVNVGEVEELLNPGQQINIHESTITQKAHSVDTRPVMAWIEGKLHVESITFADFAVVLERAFKVNIYIRNERLKNKKFTGKFENDENLDQILQVMKTSMPFDVIYNKETNTLIIR